MRHRGTRRSGVRSRWGSGLLGILLGVALAFGAAVPANAYDEGTIVALANEARASNGLGGLVRNASLDAVALGWAQQLAASGSLGHNPSVGAQIPGGWTAWGENVAQGYGTGAAVHAGWMNSSGHRANILGGFTDIGVALIQGGGTTWAVQVFARYPGSGLPAPAPAAPAPAPAPAAPAPVPVPAAPAPAPAPPVPAAEPTPSAVVTPSPDPAVEATPAASPATAESGAPTALHATVDAATRAQSASANAGGLPSWSAPLLVLVLGLIAGGALLLVGRRRNPTDSAGS